MQRRSSRLNDIIVRLNAETDVPGYLINGALFKTGRRTVPFCSLVWFQGGQAEAAIMCCDSGKMCECEGIWKTVQELLECSHVGSGIYSQVRKRATRNEDCQVLKPKGEERAYADVRPLFIWKSTIGKAIGCRRGQGAYARSSTSVAVEDKS